MIKVLYLLIFFLSSLFFIERSAFAGGVAAQRNRPAGASTTSSGRPQIQGPPVNLGRRQHTVYAPPAKKSVILPPVLPFEAKNEVKKSEPAPAKKAQPIYKSDVLTTSSERNRSVTNVSQPPSRKSSSSPVSPEMTVLFERMDQSSELWLNLNDMQIKTLIVSHYVDLYQQFGVNISKPVPYYINMIDGMAKNNPQMLTQPFDQILRVVAILEYDYGSGENKDALASSILTDRNAFLKNKQRLGIK